MSAPAAVGTTGPIKVLVPSSQTWKRARCSSALQAILRPWAGVSYLSDYLWLLAHHESLRWTFLVGQGALVVRTFYFLFLALCSTNTDGENYAHYDVYFLLVGKWQQNLVCCATSLHVLYLNWALFTRVDHSLLRDLQRVVLNRQWRHFFLSPRVSFLKNVHVCDLVRRVFLVSVNLTVMLIANVDCLLSYFYLRCVWGLLQLEWSSWLAFWWSIVTCHISCLTFSAYMLNFVHIIALYHGQIMSLLVMFALRWRQLCVQLAACATDHGPRPVLRGGVLVLRRRFTRTLVFFFRINRMYSSLFLAFLVSYVPISVLYGCWLLQGRLATVPQTNIIAWAAWLGNLVFGWHALFAGFSRRIHAPTRHWFTVSVRLMHHHMVQKQGKGKKETTGDPHTKLCRTTLQLALYISAMHTVRKYGVTYGFYGLVSLIAFTKFLMLYGEFCMFFYKKMQQELI